MANDTRISKLLSTQGRCSRREADRFLANGWVLVDGEPAVVGQKVNESAQIELLPEALKELGEKVTVLLNKPVGYVSNLPEKNYKEARELLVPQNRCKEETSRLNPRGLKNLAVAGRLDIESQGLLVFTQSGVLAKKLIGEHSKMEREYLVRVQGSLDEEGLKRLNHGLSLDGQALKPARVEWLNKDQLRFVLREGKKRQIRRMCEEVGIKVTGLKRVRIGRIKLGKLAEGQWRLLGEHEVF